MSALNIAAVACGFFLAWVMFASEVADVEGLPGFMFASEDR